MTNFRSKAPWAILLSGVIAGLATVAQANDRQVDSLAYWDYVRCNEDAARKLIRHEIAQTTDSVAFGVLSRQVMALKAMTACQAEQDTLAAVLPAGLPSDFRSHMQRYNEAVVATEIGTQKHEKLCAGAEWIGCSMKPIPNWKANRP
jgi:hypothetical protein